MRSINSQLRSIDNINARQSAKSIVRGGSDRPSPSMDALFGFALYAWETMHHALRPWATATTRATKTRVTGGASRAEARSGSGRHAFMCRLAAR